MRTLITNARIIDGTGAPARDGELLIEDDTISSVGGADRSADTVLDARGHVVAPGFIDMHSHGDFTLPDDPLASAKILQGVTTEVVANCGLGVFPANPRVDEMYTQFAPLIFGEGGHKCSPTLEAYRERLEQSGVSVNAACLVPHGNVRAYVMGTAERAPDGGELRAMESLIDEAMRQGGFGLSTGLVYAPGVFSHTDELVTLARRLKPFGGFYASHIRDEASKVVESVAEAITVGEQAGVGVQISHHKAIGVFNWGKVKTTLGLVDRARARGVDVHSDVYPYTAGATILAALVLSPWIFAGTPEQVIARLRDPATRERLMRENQEKLEKLATVPRALEFVPKRWIAQLMLALMSRVIVVSSVRHRTEYEGKSLHAVARMRRQSFYDAMFDMLAEEEVAVAAIGHVLSERDVRTVMRHPQTMIGTDGFPMREGKPHPRTFGTYPRVLEHYVRQRGVLRLEDAVHRMTGLPAKKLGMKRRGVIARGAAADLVVFDPGGVRDHATYRDPKRSPDGITHVFVNGAWTVKDGKHSGARAGRVLRRQVEAKE